MCHEHSYPRVNIWNSSSYSWSTPALNWLQCAVKVDRSRPGKSSSRLAPSTATQVVQETAPSLTTDREPRPWDPCPKRVSSGADGCERAVTLPRVAVVSECSGRRGLSLLRPSRDHPSPPQFINHGGRLAVCHEEVEVPRST